jgi:hypothetical protein
MVRAVVERDLVHPNFLDESPLEIGNSKRLPLDDIDDGPERYAPRHGTPRRGQSRGRTRPTIEDDGPDPPLEELHPEGRPQA